MTMILRSAATGLVCICLLLLCAMPAAGQCNPAEWLPGDGMPGVGGQVHALTMWDPDGAGPSEPVLAIGGAFTTAGDVLANRIATFDPVTGQWAALGAGMNTTVRALAALPNGELVAGGDFTTSGGVTVNRIARWDGTSWSAIGAGMNDDVRALAVLQSGDLVAGGDFTTAGGVAAHRIARWDGTSWSALPGGLNATSVRALAVRPSSGELFVGWDSSISRWNGTSWNLSLFVTGANPLVHALLFLPSGHLVVGGEFTNVGGVTVNNIARWNGMSWSGLGRLHSRRRGGGEQYRALGRHILVRGGTWGQWPCECPRRPAQR
jgi:hypothetical protein